MDAVLLKIDGRTDGRTCWSVMLNKRKRERNTKEVMNIQISYWHVIAKTF